MPRSRSRSRSHGRRTSRSPPTRRGSSRSPRRSRSGSRGRRDRSVSRPSGEHEVMQLEGEAVAYVLGRDGTTKRRLEKCSGCQLEVGSDTITVYGSATERKLGMFFIEVTLQQRNKKMNLNFDELEDREDCEKLDVPKECVGFVLGNRGATLRGFEDQSAAYMVFDNETMREGKKRLYILGQRKSRAKARELVEEAVNFRLSKDSGGGSRNGRSSRSRSPRRRSPRRRSRTPSRTRHRRGSSHERRRSRSRGR